MQLQETVPENHNPEAGQGQCYSENKDCRNEKAQGLLCIEEEQEEDDKEMLSEYERQRLKRIEENNRTLVKLASHAEHTLVCHQDTY